jgi:hypothetical protein
MNILHLIIGLLLIMLALYPIGKLNSNFLETYIIISIINILKNNYYIIKRL